MGRWATDRPLSPGSSSQQRRESGVRAEGGEQERALDTVYPAGSLFIGLLQRVDRLVRMGVTLCNEEASQPNQMTRLKLPRQGSTGLPQALARGDGKGTVVQQLAAFPRRFSAPYRRLDSATLQNASINLGEMFREWLVLALEPEPNMINYCSLLGARRCGGGASSLDIRCRP